MTSLYRLTIFLTVVATVYAVSALILLHGLVRAIRSRCRQRGEPDLYHGSAVSSRGQKWFRRAILLAAAAGIPLMLYSIYVEPYTYTIERVKIHTSKITGPDPIRIVQISDLHSDPEARLEPILPEVIADLSPDVVVFTGDAINSYDALETFRGCMRKIASAHPTFGVMGNWEKWWFSDVDVFENTGVKELNGTSVPLQIRNDEIWITGVAVDCEATIPDALKQVPDEKFSLFLHHYPAWASTAAEGGADLHLAGDTHGGQVRLPWIGALVRMQRNGIWRPCGLQREGRLWLYVNRGIGMEGRSAPRMRFLCRPEVTLIELCPAGVSERE